MHDKPPMPTGVAVLSMLAILIGLFSIIGGAILLSSPDLTIVALNAVAIVVGILFLLCGIGFFRAARWAWTLGILVAALSIVRNIVEAVQGLIIAAIPGMLLALAIIYYLTTPPVKAYFGRAVQATRSAASNVPAQWTVLLP